MAVGGAIFPILLAQWSFSRYCVLKPWHCWSWGGKRTGSPTDNRNVATLFHHGKDWMGEWRRWLGGWWRGEIREEAVKAFEQERRWARGKEALWGLLKKTDDHLQLHPRANTLIRHAVWCSSSWAADRRPTCLPYVVYGRCWNELRELHPSSNPSFMPSYAQDVHWNQ